MKRAVHQKILCLGFIAVLVLVFLSAFSFAAELDDVKAAIKAKGAAWTAGETSVSSLPAEQRKLRTRLIRPHATGAEEIVAVAPPPTGIPLTLDWRNYNTLNYVTGIRDQGSCGSCWAFATTAGLESYTLIQNNTPGQDLNLSEQVLVSCGGAGNCSGGYIDKASNYIESVGLPQESCYPYTATNGACANACTDYKVNTYHIGTWNYVSLTSPNLTAIKNALNAYGPLVTTMQVYSDFFYYKSGVYSYTSGTLQGGHAILIIGYDDTTQSFIVKNSWGTGWGEGGFFNIAYSQLGNVVQFGYWTIAYQPGAAPTPCSYSLSPTSANFAAAGGKGTIKVTCGSGCGWVVQSNAAWITVTSGSSGTGNGSISYQVAANTTGGTRAGTISVAGQTFTVNQRRK